MNEKFEVAQSHINNFDIRIKHLKNEINNEQKDLAKYLEQDNFYWLGVTAKRIKELSDEIEYFRKTKKEMQEMLNYMMKE